MKLKRIVAAPKSLRLILSGLTLMTISFASVHLIAEEQAIQQTSNPLQVIMQELLADSNLLTEGIILSDYDKIASAAKRIAEHPTPEMKTKMKLVAALGAEMASFKSNDDIVHNAAVTIHKAAVSKNMDLVLSEYSQMIQGCQSCHSQFKQRVSDILR